jgi:hypothetical protein
MGNRVRTAIAALGALVLLSVAGCEGLFTGERESVHSLSVREDGSFAPVRLQLAPAMNPIAFNLKGSTIAHYAESGRWNAYRVTLSLDGAPVAIGRFNVNNRGTREIEEGGEFATTMLFASVPREGEYELAIELTEPKAITVESPRLEVRRNTEPPPGTAVGAQ